MIDAPIIDNDRLLLPPDRFYWSVIDASIIGGRIRNPQRQLGYLFENVLPVPVEQVHAVYWRLPAAKQFLACGMARESLQREIEQKNGSMTHLGPEGLPEFLREELADGDVPIQRLNLLNCEFQPQAVRVLHRSIHRWMTVFVLIAIALLLIGAERRTADLYGQAGVLHEARTAIYREVLPTVGGIDPRQPPELRMTAELRRLRQTRQAPDGPSASSLEMTDCTPALAALLARWPRDVHMQTDSISITPTAMTIRGAAPTSQDIQKLADALTRVPGWQIQQPQVNAGRDGVQASLQLSRTSQPSTAGEP